MNSNERSGGQKILVTGAAGFIGSHLCETLVNRGHKVVGLLGPNCDTRWINHLEMSLFNGDLSEKPTLRSAVQGVSRVYHLAGVLGGSDSDLLFKTNYEGTRNLVETCLECGITLKRFLFVSSHAAMGPTPRDKLYNEDMPCCPVSDYGRSKWMAEKYLRSVNGKLPSTIVRLPVIYGPRSLKGFYSVYKLLDKRLFFDIDKGESNVGYVQDIVEGIIDASESQNTVGKVYFLGSKRIYSLNEMFEGIQKAVGKKALKIKVPYFIAYLFAASSELHAKLRGGPALLYRKDIKYPFWRMDVSQAEKDFGYKSKTPLEEGLQKTAEWYRRNGFL